MIPSKWNAVAEGQAETPGTKIETEASEKTIEKKEKRHKRDDSGSAQLKVPPFLKDFGGASLRFLDRYWHWVALGAIFVLFLWLHGIPARLMTKYLPDIDVYYIFRIAENTFLNGFALTSFDPLRYFPIGFDPRLELIGDYYLPAVLYGITNLFTRITFFDFAIWLPVVLSGLAIFPLYGIGKEVHNKYTGLLAAFFFAVIAGSFFRTSAGEFEKEALSVLFWFSSFYFFIAAVKTRSWLKGTLAGLSIMVMGITWGGVQFALLVFAGVVLASLLVNKNVRELLPAYSPIVFFVALLSLNHYGFLNPPFLLNFLALGLLLLRIGVERFSLIPKDKLRFFVPGAFGLFGIGTLVASFVSSTVANVLFQIQTVAFYTQTGALGQTVAEDIPPVWSQFVDSLGAASAVNIFPQLGPLLPLFGLWIAAFLGVLVMLYKIHEKKNWEFGLAALVWLVNMLSLILYYNRPDPALQAVYVVSMLALIVLTARKNFGAAFAMTLIYFALTGALVRIRFFYIAGPFIALLAAYFASNFFSWITKNAGFKDEWRDRGLALLFGEAALFGAAIISAVWFGPTSLFAWVLAGTAAFIAAWAARKRIRLAPQKIAAFTLVALLAGLYLVTNFGAAFAIANSIGPSFNDNWDAAMNYMKNETPEESVILSWWDFGYWFQLMGQRATVMDGGNAYSQRNTEAAKYFTGDYDIEKQKAYLQRYGVTHVLVDTSMILKYSAMSKIATDNAQIDAFGQFILAQRTQRDNRTILVYDGGGGNSILVPINPNTGGLSGNVVLSTPQGQGYIKEVCSAQGRVPLNPPEDLPSIDGCIVIFGQNLFFANPRVADSTFTKIYFEEGRDLGYLEKVFDNTEVKIFKVNLPLKGREELLEEWEGLGCEFYCFTPGAGLPQTKAD